MRRPWDLVRVVAFVVPLSVGAVTWQMDSSPFSFADVGITPHPRPDRNAGVFRYKTAVHGRVVTVQCELPSGVADATLSIHLLSGRLIESFALHSGSNTVTWRMKRFAGTSGLYLAAIRYGSVAKTIPLCAVK